MTALIVVGSVVLFFIIILFLPIILYLEYNTAKPEISDQRKISNDNYSPVIIHLRYIFKFKIYPKKPRIKRIKRKKTKKKVEKENEKFTSSKLKEIISIAKTILVFLKKPIKLLLKHIKIYDLLINVDFSCGDAAETGIFYGRLMAYFYGGYGFFSNFFNIKLKKVNFNCKYTDDLFFDINGSGKIKSNLFTLLLSGILFFIKFIKTKGENEIKTDLVEN